jgi:tetratricopeptide (TPR) repeat protein
VVIWQQIVSLQLAFIAQVLAHTKAKFGDAHPSTLLAVGNLASTLYKNGRFVEAMALDKEAWESSKAAHGEDSDNSLDAAGNYALSLRKHGALADAARLQRETLETRKRKFGPNNPSIIMDLRSLAQILFDQRELDAAEEMQVQTASRFVFFLAR